MVTLHRHTRSGAASEEFLELVNRVKTEVDLRQYVLPKLRQHRSFGAYWLANCLNPEHTDEQMSLLIFSDGCSCRACGWYASAINLYRAEHRGISAISAARALLADPGLKFNGEAQPVREYRALDQDLAAKFHLKLAGNIAAIAQLEAMGFTKAAIRHFQIGLSEVFSLVPPKEYPLIEGAQNIEWREIEGERLPYQQQLRFSVPVFDKGQLRQFIYRKRSTEDLGSKVQLHTGAGTEWLFNTDALRGAESVVQVEGWGDAIVLWQSGIAAVSGISGAGQFRPEWVERLGTIKRQYVVGDQDEAGRKMMARVKRSMPWVRGITLPAMERGGDIRDLWLAGWRREEFLGLLKQADMRAFKR